MITGGSVPLPVATHLEHHLPVALKAAILPMRSCVVECSGDAHSPRLANLTLDPPSSWKVWRLRRAGTARCGLAHTGPAPRRPGGYLLVPSNRRDDGIGRNLPAGGLATSARDRGARSRTAALSWACRRCSAYSPHGWWDTAAAAARTAASDVGRADRRPRSPRGRCAVQAVGLLDDARPVRRDRIRRRSD